MKPYLATIFLMISLSAMGQKQRVEINYKPSFTYFGKQAQKFKNPFFFSRKGKQTFNNAVNILYSYKLSSAFSVSTGLEYAQQGQHINFSADSAFPSGNRKIFSIELNYVRIPLTINYITLKKKKSALDIYSGISVGIAVKRKDNYQDIIPENIQLPPSEKRYKKKDWALPIGMNYKKELNSKLYLNFGIEYLIGLTEAFSGNPLTKFGVLSEFDNSRQSRLSLSIGLGFKFAK